MIKVKARRAAVTATGVVLLSASAMTSGSATQPVDHEVLPSVAVADQRPEIQSLSVGQRQELQREIDATLTSHGGVQISANEIAWNGGEPTLTFPLPGEDEAPQSSPQALRQKGIKATDVEPLADWGGCPAGKDDNRWYCFYDEADFKGRRLQWNWAHCSGGIRFGDYGFDNKTTGWVNTTPNKSKVGMVVTVYDGWFTGSLWVERPWTKVSKVDSFHNNKASSFKACRIS
ncbi:peptidase inhibitor family I36 protein [Streptomyces sp. NPDC057554]|uniref:peptidase inhibitor family I36 protein n=1 Tax=Streptomyces sp. NPDC057554 TaxID=3350538 RepID=UPI00367626C6